VLRVRVGTAPVNWNNQDVPDYRPKTPYEQMLDEMAAAGYAGTEIDSSFPHNPEQVKRDLRVRGLRPASSFCAVNLRTAATRATEIERALELAAFLAALDQEFIIIADSGDEQRRALAGHVDARAVLDDASWEHLVTGLHELARRCRELGMRIVFHNHVGTYIETESELNRLLEETDPTLVGLCYDVGHMLYAGGDVMRVVERYGERIHYVHLKDVDLRVLERCRRERLGFREALRLGIFTEFGTGGVDFKRFFAALDALDYTGWLIVEQDTTKKTPFESAKINRAYLRDTFGL
jgi:inosose dehydratase